MGKTPITEFSKKVIALIQKIPLGKVATYGQIAKLAGKPQGSRGVSWILSSSSKAYKLPWHRVVNSQGRISFPTGSAEYKKQKSLLLKEGVLLKENGSLDLKAFGWQKNIRSPKKKSNQPQLFSE